MTLLPFWFVISPSFLFALLYRSKKYPKLFLALFIICLFFLVSISGLQLNIKTSSDTSVDSLRLASLNIGANKDLKYVKKFINTLDVDVVAFQEANQHIIKSLIDKDGWKIFCQGELCVATELTVKNSGAKSRRLMQDWGNFVARFEIDLPTGTIDLFNVHLETPREGIEGLIFEKISGIALFKHITERRRAESSIASNWAKQGRSVIVVGDFNMTVRSPIYRSYWSWLENAFDVGGVGLGNTKFTRWHGVRIDHVLYDYLWKARKVWIGPDLGGDHRPLIVELIPN